MANETQMKALGSATTGQKGSLDSIFGSLTRSPDMVIALLVIGIVLMMVFPMPALLLDLLLALSMSSSLVILMVAVYIQRPLDFGVFPTVLLIATLFRLSLNVATTRSILMNGAEGNLSHMIQAFGNLVIGNNFVVGIVIFLILTIINFIVITKGSGRIAEVAARFTLDALPGKQMAIDAELNAGHISSEEAKKRRKELERETDFYGAMDGSSKFVRGDAIAGIIITAINMIVGLIVGIVQHGMSALESAQNFTLLAVGDGLIAAIPALMISTAAGIIVTRATSEGNLGDQVLDQFRVHPRALYVASALIFLLALIPGFPTITFLLLATGLFALGRLAGTRLKAIETAAEAPTEKDKPNEGDDLDALMHIDTLAVEVGHALVDLIDPSQDGEVLERVQSIRKQIAQELGIVVPKVQLRDNLELDPTQYCILLKGNKIASGHLMVDFSLAMDPGDVQSPIDGEPTKDPVYGLPALWVHKRDRDEAVFRGYTVVNCSTVIATHLTKVLKEGSHELLTRQDAQVMVDRLKESNPKVVEEVLHSDRLSLGDIVKVLQHLLREDVSVRNILSIFECLADNCRQTRNPEVLGEYCRRDLGRSIVQKYLNDREELVALTFDRLIEDQLSGGLVTTESGSTYLNLDAGFAQSILHKIVDALQGFEDQAPQPVLLISARLRYPFRNLVHRYMSQLVVMSYDEVPSETRVRTFRMIT